MKNPDQVYLIPDVGLWGIAEEMAGFLIIGIPSVPKAVKTIPLSNSVKSFISTWVGTSSQGSNEDTPPWRRNPLSRKRRGLWSITGTDLDEQQLVTINVSRPTQIDTQNAPAQPTAWIRYHELPS